MNKTNDDYFSDIDASREDSMVIRLEKKALGKLHE
jgi:hypothetical protein